MPHKQKPKPYTRKPKKKRKPKQYQQRALLKNIRKKRPDYKYPKKQLAMGIKVEMEHTNNREVAKDIAKDHLDERRDYYTRLKKVEQENGKKRKKSFPKNGHVNYPHERHTKVHNRLHDHTTAHVVKIVVSPWPEK